VPILFSPEMRNALVRASKARSLGERLKAFANIRPAHLAPVTPAIAEPTTGLTMGQSAEQMAQANGITREAQDRWALRSHQLAAAGTADGRLTREIAAAYIPPKFEKVVAQDNGIRADTSYEKLASLKPVFDRKYGTVTAGNASPLNDGAGALLLGDEAAGAAIGREPLARIAGRAAAGVDPDVFGIAPVEAANRALERAGIGWDDVVIAELNEAFASQTLACLEGWPDLDPDKLNVNGGAIAIGHPLGASGVRILATLAHELRRRGGGYGVASICIGVGQGLAVVLEA
jgi:acetyl-CoA acyltransferase